VGCRRGTSGMSRRWGPGRSRAEPSQRAADDLRERAGSCRLRAGARRGRGADADAAVGALRVARSHPATSLDAGKLRRGVVGSWGAFLVANSARRRQAPPWRGPRGHRGACLRGVVFRTRPRVAPTWAVTARLARCARRGSLILPTLPTKGLAELGKVSGTVIDATRVFWWVVATGQAE